mmetsp:Transcript_10126/g.19497  ORF Transcript_10126/g.19497 Transcript_10126/m.19497 type:complete len:160 (+) Transcript_10126:1545-2024(+)
MCTQRHKQQLDLESPASLYSLHWLTRKRRIFLGGWLRSQRRETQLQRTEEKTHVEWVMAMTHTIFKRELSVWRNEQEDLCGHRQCAHNSLLLFVKLQKMILKSISLLPHNRKTRALPDGDESEDPDGTSNDVACAAMCARATADEATQNINRVRLCCLH